MKVEVRHLAAPRTEFQRPSAFGPLALLAIGVPLEIWWFVFQLGGGGSASGTLDAMAGCFVILATAYCGLHGLRNTAWTSIPVLVTFEALVYFLAIPAWQFAKGEETMDGYYVLAALLTLVGFAAFWLGSAVLMREKGVRFAPRVAYTPSRVQLASVVLLVLGVIGNVVIWRIGLLGYSGDAATRATYSGVLGWLTFICNLLNYALVVSAIEMIGKRSAARSIKVVFWLSLLFSVSFGVLSGMKSGPLIPFAYIAFLYGIIRRRMPRSALLIPLVLVVFVYPFVGAYRANLNGGYRAQFNTVGGLEDTVVESFDKAFFSFGAGNQGTREQDLRNTRSRLSYLSYVRDVCSLPDPSMLQSDEKLWMAPLYPFVPRFLWKSKPVLNFGQRFSILLGRGDKTASAPTPIGDLYSAYGIWGVALGMFVWGACLQLYMNWVGNKPASERVLFVYVILLLQLLVLEEDFTGLVAGSVQACIVAMITSYLIYGPASTSAKLSDRMRHSSQASHLPLR
jgi:hypothetical protein